MSRIRPWRVLWAVLVGVLPATAGFTRRVGPLSQMIVKFTNPMLIPLRRVIPGFGGLDVASLVLAFAAQYLLITLVAMLAFKTANLPWLLMLGWSAVGLLKLILRATHRPVQPFHENGTPALN